MKDGTVTMERLNDAVTRVLALKAVCFAPECTEAADGPAWHREAAQRAVTLVKNSQPDVFPVTPERYPKIRLIVLGKNDILDGSVEQIALEYLKKQGFDAKIYEPYKDNLHGTANLPKDRLTLYLANPYLLQDAPRIKTHINAYTATRTVIETVIDKLMVGGPFAGVSPVDAFCGLPDTRL